MSSLLFNQRDVIYLSYVVDLLTDCWRLRGSLYRMYQQSTLLCLLMKTFVGFAK